MTFKHLMRISIHSTIISYTGFTLFDSKSNRVCWASGCELWIQQDLKCRCSFQQLTKAGASRRFQEHAGWSRSDGIWEKHSCSLHFWSTHSWISKRSFCSGSWGGSVCWRCTDVSKIWLLTLTPPETQKARGCPSLEILYTSLISFTCFSAPSERVCVQKPDKTEELQW